MKYLALDIGNVLVNQDMEPFIKAISKQMNLSIEEVNHFTNRIQRKQDLGITSIRDELATQFSIKSEYIVEELIDAWHKVVQPNITSIQFLNDMVNELDIDVALVSNLGFEHMAHFSSVLKDADVYKNSIHHFSCEVGARKPSLLYYKAFLDLHPKFNRCIYVDDLAENLAAGQAQGLKPFQFDLSKHAKPSDTIIKLCELKALFTKNQ